MPDSVESVHTIDVIKLSVGLPASALSICYADARNCVSDAGRCDGSVMRLS